METRLVLDATDRCDACGAQARVQINLPSGNHLLMCAHHGRAHQKSLKESGAVILDPTEALAPAV
ncbi:MAG: hypothetical protein Q4G30_02990 [Actinomycetaceae bacterium]|nr:hypothetical protein [Actinomycetaceae bacterium]